MRRSIACLCLLLAAAPLAAEVKIVVREDGQKTMVNEAPAVRERRLSATLLPASDPELTRLIDEHAGNKGLDPQLVQAVIQAESGYNPRALSNKGAMGLMQLMPGTAQDLAVADPWDPDQNIRGGVSYLRSMLDRFGGSLELALAAYNAGPEAVAKYDGVPPFAETREYVDRVLRLFRGEGLAAAVRVGRPVFLTRDANNRILLTTSGLGQP